MSEVVLALKDTKEGRRFGRKLIQRYFRIDSMFAMSDTEASMIVRVANTLNGYPEDKYDHWDDGYDLAISKLLLSRLSINEISESAAHLKLYRNKQGDKQ